MLAPTKPANHLKQARVIQSMCSKMHLPRPALSQVLLLGPAFHRRPFLPRDSLQTRQRQHKLTLKVFSGRIWRRRNLKMAFAHTHTQQKGANLQKNNFLRRQVIVAASALSRRASSRMKTAESERKQNENTGKQNE